MRANPPTQVTREEIDNLHAMFIYRRIFDVVMHSNKQTGIMEWRMHPKIVYNFSIHLKFCDLEDCTL